MSDNSTAGPARPRRGDTVVQYREQSTAANVPAVVALVVTLADGTFATMRASFAAHAGAGPRFESAARELAQASGHRALRWHWREPDHYELLWPVVDKDDVGESAAG
ncbi:MAG: hypothetical protein H0V80_07375 [Acidobacteria bacterium]|nr:hypothetical protein [Acidobacteriota bacterium]